MITFKVRWAKLCYIQHTLLNFFLRKVNECPKSIYLETIFKMLEFFYNFFIFLIKVVLKLFKNNLLTNVLRTPIIRNLYYLRNKF